MSGENKTGVEFRRGPQTFIERREKATRTALLSPDIRTRGGNAQNLAARRSEFASLAGAIRLDVLAHETVPVRAVRPATYFGGGQVEAFAEKFEELGIELVLVDAALSPIQQRNLERGLKVKVLDRTALILEIFGERAATREGVLQVELAHLNYQRSRLVRSWTHLERQRGGFGFLGGPGETQIEADRRQLRERIALLEKRIEKVRKTRQMQRKPRDAVPFPL
ncbi:MAG TPA: GTPase HflX, partial [Devosia sp.]|nr:GTPase HflX [Devosia sp.]